MILLFKNNSILAWTILQCIQILVPLISLRGGQLVHSQFLCGSASNEKEESVTKPSLPRLRLEAENGTEILSRPGPQAVLMRRAYISANEYSHGFIQIVCTAQYPVSLLYKRDFTRDLLLTMKAEDYHVSYTNFENKSTYIFETRAHFYVNFDYNSNNTFVCQSVNDKTRVGCPLMKSAERLEFFGPDDPFPNTPMSFLLRTSSPPLTPHAPPVKIITNISEFTPPEEAVGGESVVEVEVCETIFYFREIVDGEGYIRYSYGCELPGEGSKGSSIVKANMCANKGRCETISSETNTSVVACWRKFVEGENCKNCTWDVTVNTILETFIPICRKPFIPSWQFVVSDDDRKRGFVTRKNVNLAQRAKEPIPEQMGHPLYLGFSTGFDIGRPQIFSGLATNVEHLGGSTNDAAAATMILMRSFEEVQLLNTTLRVKCISSSAYTTRTFQFILEFEREGSKFEYLEVHNDAQELKWKGGRIWSQARTIELNDTAIKSITCAAGVQNSYDWVKVSRPLRVVDYPDFYKPGHGNCPSSDRGPKPNMTRKSALKPPTILLSYEAKYFWERGETIHIPEDTSHFILEGGRPVSVGCMATYPVQALFLHHERWVKDDPGANYQNVKFSQFRNSSTYKFSIYIVQLLTQRETNFIRCQAMMDPCLQSTVRFDSIEGVNGSDNQISLSYIPPDELHPTLDTTLGIPPQREECESTIFYRKSPEVSGYEFRCEFHLQEAGVVQFHYCNSLMDCNNLYRHRRQSKKCWKQVSAWRPCEGCKEVRSTGFRPFLLICDNDERTKGGQEYDSSVLGNFAFFGVSTKSGEIPPIYFDETDGQVDPDMMIHLYPFNEHQIVDTDITFTCKSSAYLTVQQSMFMAAEIESKIDLVTLDENRNQKNPPDTNKLDDTLHNWVRTQTVRFDMTAQTVRRVYCFAMYWKTGQYINSSRPISLLKPREPEIRLGVQSHENSFQEVSAMGGHHGFQLDAESQSIICHAYGYPPPKILWASTQDVPEPIYRIENSTHSSSRIDFPVIHRSLAGTYICSASNLVNKTKASLLLHVTTPVNPTVVGTVVGACVLLVVSGTVVYLLWRRYKKINQTLRDLTDPEINDFLHGRSSEDPDDVHAPIYSLPYNQLLEISRSLIELDETTELGSGQFGVVVKGYIKRTEFKELVAVKTVRSDVSVECFKVLLAEIKIMAYVDKHDNVIQLIGACTASIRKRQVLAAVEFCENGDLKKFLRKHQDSFIDLFDLDATPPASPCRTSFVENEKNGGYVSTYVGMPIVKEQRTLSTQSLLNFSQGVANGMAYLTTKNVVHGDLAARNILLTGELEVKISDFGLSRQLPNYVLYIKDQQEVLIPWMWMSIEALQEGKFSINSDIWSFGVLLWEIFSLGQTPYPGSTWCPQFVEDLVKGCRMECPDFANNKVYDLMMSCWAKNPNDRPPFSKILDEICLIQTQLELPPSTSDTD